jgi:hypothetical protein
MVLGVYTPSQTFTYILAHTVSDEESVLQYTYYVLSDIPGELVAELKENKNNTPEDFDMLNTLSFTTEDSSKQNTAEILSKLAITNPALDTSISKDDILAGIENPTETVKTPSFALPKSKPQTTNILSSLAKPADPAKSIDQDMIQSGEDADITIDAIVDPFMKSIGNGVLTPNQVHTSETDRHTSTADILSQATTQKSQNTPAQDILETMNAKLQQVQGIAPTETYKVADTPRHDPYREIPSM